MSAILFRIYYGEFHMQKIFLTAITACLLSACTAHSNSENVTSIENPSIQTPPLNGAANLIAPPQLTERVIQPDIYVHDYPATPEVLREGRYTLVALAPEDGQKYLLDQSVTVTVPQKNKKVFNANVENGLAATLKNTGLELCHRFNHNEPTLPTLFSRQLPKVHYQFGPMKLREALQMLAGPAYEITLNDITRTVCFKQRSVLPENMTRAPHPIETKTVTTTTTEIIEE